MKKIFTIFAALTLSAGLWAQGSVFTYKATEKLDAFQYAAGPEVSVVSHEFDAGTGEGTVTYSSTVTTIYGSAFSNERSLLSINIPEGVITIGEGAFVSCFSLGSVELPASLTTIGNLAFADCNFQTITIPASVTTIGEMAFGGCTNSTSVTFLGNACQNAIGEAAFGNVGTSYNPATLNLPNDWTGSKPAQDGSWYGGYFKLPAPVVGDQFVVATSGLKFEVTAVGETNTVKVINNSYSGTSYTVPATVKYNDVDFAVTTIGEEAFQWCETLESVELPASVTEIESAAFQMCTSLKSIELSASLTTIGDNAFNYCSSLQSITIPASVTTIKAAAFAECADLTSVTFLGNACQDAIGEMAFYGVGNPTPAALTLPANWTGTLPDEDGNWYSGKFELVSTALPNVDSKFKIQNSKLIINGRLIIRSGNKKYNALGTEL